MTGATGFVGRHLCAHLRESGDEVAGLDHRDATRAVDITDPAAVRHVVHELRPDAVYHLAAVSHVGRAWDAPARVFRVNAEGTLHVLAACADARVGRVLVAGSADVYGAVSGRDLPIGEDAPLRPLTPYGASKAAADLLALQAHLGTGLQTIRVRAFNHTGPGQQPDFLVPALARRIVAAEREGASQVRVGSLAPVRDITDVRDVVRAYRLLIERGEAGGAYNVCSGRGSSVAELADRLLHHADRQLRLSVDPALVRPVEVPRLVGDPSKLRTATGWEPAIALDTTLADVIAVARRD